MHVPLFFLITAAVSPVARTYDTPYKYQLSTGSWSPNTIRHQKPALKSTSHDANTGRLVSQTPGNTLGTQKPGSLEPNPVSTHIVHPCKLDNYACIRDNLAANSNCNPKVQGFALKQYTLPAFRFETPFFNSSYIDHDLLISNLDKCFISAFFFNTESDVAVLSLDCPDLYLRSKRTLIQHYSLREDVMYSFNFNGEYPLVRMTASMSHANKLDLCTAFIFSDVAALPNFIVDPNDKPTASFLSHDLSKMNIYERENFFYRGPRLFRRFINWAICDFACA